MFRKLAQPLGRHLEQKPSLKQTNRTQPAKGLEEDTVCDFPKLYVVERDQKETHRREDSSSSGNCGSRLFKSLLNTPVLI